MFENISKKQEKIQEKVQKQQERNDKDCRELTDEELDQVVGGMPKKRDAVAMALRATVQLAQLVPAGATAMAAADAVQLMRGASAAHWGPDDDKC